MQNIYELMLTTSYFILGFVVCKVWMKRNQKTVWNDLRIGITEKLILPKYHMLVSTLSKQGVVRLHCQHKPGNHYEESYYVDATGQIIEDITHWRKE